MPRREGGGVGLDIDRYNITTSNFIVVDRNLKVQ